MSSLGCDTLLDTRRIATSVQMGKDCMIWHGATICDEVVLGDGVVVGSHVWIGRGCRIGEGTRIQHGVFLPNQTIIGASVFIGPNVTLTDDRWPRVQNPRYQAEPPILEDHCNIGAGAILLPGVRIGHHATVGAGAVVTEDVAPSSVVVGCPAREMNTV